MTDEHGSIQTQGECDPQFAPINDVAAASEKPFIMNFPDQPNEPDIAGGLFYVDDGFFQGNCTF
jgi:hypothetical protein